jgi:hypothetical protein
VLCNWLVSCPLGLMTHQSELASANHKISQKFADSPQGCAPAMALLLSARNWAATGQLGYIRRSSGSVGCLSSTLIACGRQQQPTSNTRSQHVRQHNVLGRQRKTWRSTIICCNSSDPNPSQWKRSGPSCARVCMYMPVGTHSLLCQDAFQSPRTFDNHIPILFFSLSLSLSFSLDIVIYLNSSVERCRHA